MKKPRISRTIWLTIAIIISGHLITMIQTGWGFRHTGERNKLVTDSLYPAAQQAHAILAAYTRQLEEIKAAVAHGKPQGLTTATSHTAAISQGLASIATHPTLPPDLRQQASEIRIEHGRFLEQATALSRLMPITQANDPLLHQGAADLDHNALALLKAFTRQARTLSQVVNNELQEISDLSRRQYQATLTLSIVIIIISIILLGSILNSALIRPLRKTLAAAEAMAGGDLSPELDIRQDDEIGALAQAMNQMAMHMDKQYQRLEEAVHDKTINLQKTNSDLLREIEHHKDTQHELLNSMEEAKKASRAKDAFLAMMSHELRTPLNGIIGMSTLAQDTDLNNTQRRYLSTITYSAESLLATINDVLDFAQIEADRLQLEAIDFAPRRIIDDLSEHMTRRAREKGLDFFTLTDPSVPNRLQGDASRLRQVLTNLVVNAIKFTQSGEVALRMEVTSATSGNATIRFSISDTGIGIAADLQQELFKPFIQADTSTARKFGGTGLGLTISQRLVNLMGGTIQVESVENEGSTFWFTITFAIPGREHQDPPLKKDRSLIYRQGKMAREPRVPFLATGKQILVADDDRTSLIVAQAILESFGCLVHLAHNGKECLARLQNTTYDLILLAARMSEMTGLEVAAAVKKWQQSPEPDRQQKSRIPMIALISDASEGARRSYLAAGMADCLEKPLRAETLARCLGKWLTAPPSRSETTPSLHIDRPRLLQRYSNDQQKVLDIIHEASTAIPHYLSELEQACTNRDCKGATATCQSIKKMGADLGIAQLQHQAIHFCLSMESGDQHRIKEQFTRLKTLLGELLRELVS